jgi:hypothetical protein
MWRLRVVWSGNAVVGPTLSTFYAQDTSPGFPAAVRSLMASLSTFIPTGTQIVVPNNGDVINPATGALTGAWTDGAAPAAVTCSGTGVYAKGVGAQIRWRTSSIVAGRRVQGSLFVVPLISAMFDSDGTLTATNQQSIATAANSYVTAAPYAVVWSRPSAGNPSATPPSPARAGSTCLIVGSSVPDRPSWLLSRRS